MSKKKIKLTEEQFYKAIGKMVLEYIGDNGMLGKEYLDGVDVDEMLGLNSQPTNELTDSDDESHDDMGVGEENIDPSYYEDFDPMNYDNHVPTDNELYNYGKW